MLIYILFTFTNQLLANRRHCRDFLPPAELLCANPRFVPTRVRDIRHLREPSFCRERSSSSSSRRRSSSSSSSRRRSSSSSSSSHHRPHPHPHPHPRPHPHRVDIVKVIARILAFQQRRTQQLLQQATENVLEKIREAFQHQQEVIPKLAFHRMHELEEGLRNSITEFRDLEAHVLGLVQGVNAQVFDCIRRIICQASEDVNRYFSELANKNWWFIVSHVRRPDGVRRFLRRVFNQTISAICKVFREAEARTLGCISEGFELTANRLIRELIKDLYKGGYAFLHDVKKELCESSQRTETAVNDVLKILILELDVLQCETTNWILAILHRLPRRRVELSRRELREAERTAKENIRRRQGYQQV